MVVSGTLSLIGAEHQPIHTVLQLATRIESPPSRVFDLKRSVDLHVASTKDTHERAVGGKTEGLLGLIFYSDFQIPEVDC